MHDSVGLQLGTSLQFAKIQLASLLQTVTFVSFRKLYQTHFCGY